jgi:hypothetical protein
MIKLKQIRNPVIRKLAEEAYVKGDGVDLEKFANLIIHQCIAAEKLDKHLDFHQGNAIKDCFEVHEELA